MKKLRILFFTPYGGHTGSEMMLWYLMSALDPAKFELMLFSHNNGSLLRHFPKHIKVEYSNSKTTVIGRIADKGIRKLKLQGLEEKQILRIHKQFKPDLWYLNTMTLSAVVSLAIKKKINYVVHFHELLTQYASVSSSELCNLIANASYTVGCSKQVCTNLQILGAKKIHLQYECVDFSKIHLHQAEKGSLKKKLRISADSLVIVMSGQRIERKGFDIFVQAAIRHKDKPYHFLWLGSSKHSGYEYFLEKCIANEGLSNISIHSPAEGSYYEHLALADLFFLSSREDPFPLVMLEAAFLAKPILAFDSGGSREFITAEVGHLLPNFNETGLDKGIEIMEQKIKSKSFDQKTIRSHALQFDAKGQSLVFEKWLLESFGTTGK